MEYNFILPSFLSGVQYDSGKHVPVVSSRTKWYVEIIMKGQPSTKSEGQPSFHVVVEAADRLTEEEQETLIELLNHRLADRRRAELVRDIQEAQPEFESGALRPTTPDEIMKEILS
jgi:polyphosphate kinase